MKKLLPIIFLLFNLMPNTVWSISEKDKALIDKVKKYKYIVEAESLYEVNKRLATYLSEDTRDSEVVSIAKAPFEDFLHPQLTPKYYNL